MKFSKGFTLIELVVVIAIFLFIVGAAIGIFISIIQGQRNILTKQQIINQVSYTEEYMSKALRMAKTDETGLTCFGNASYAGYIYLLTRHTNSHFTGIKFFNQTSNECEEFYWDSNSKTLKKVVYTGGTAGTPIDITSANMQINSIRIAINGESKDTDASCIGNNTCGATTGVSEQPKVTISLQIAIPGETAPTIIQTTTSQRNLNTNNGQR